jgi:hypothetical protein
MSLDELLLWPAVIWPKVSAQIFDADKKFHQVVVGHDAPVFDLKILTWFLESRIYSVANDTNHFTIVNGKNKLVCLALSLTSDYSSINLPR